MDKKYSVNFNGKIVPLTKTFLDEYKQILEEHNLIDIFSCFVDNDGTFAYIYDSEERQKCIDTSYDDGEYYYDDYDVNYLTPVISQVDPYITKGYKDGDDCFVNDTYYTVLDSQKGIIATTKHFELNVNELYFESPFYRFLCEQEKKHDTSGFKNINIPISYENKKRFLLDDNLNNCPENAFNQIITGETGCGKTYKAINDEINANRRFLYIAPCRQLVYETYMKYAAKQDSLTSGEIKINGEKDGNIFGVFESASEKMLENIDTLIIDEAHFVNDTERGQHLLNLIAAAREKGINLKLLTATQSFELNGFEEIYLKSRFKVPVKKEISFEEAYQNMQNGMQTIYFASTINGTEDIANMLCEEGIKAVAMTSRNTPSERLQTQIDFEKQKIQVVVATNLLAQGVNFTCQNLIISLDGFNTPELVQQKIGRLGRPNTLEGVDEVYYAIEGNIEEVKKPGYITKVQKGEVDKSYVECALEECIYMIKDSCVPGYNDMKYCIPEFKEYIFEKIKDENISEWVKDTCEKALEEISTEQNKVKEIILANAKYNLKQNDKDAFFKMFEKAVNEDKNYIEIDNKQIPFKRIPCSDMIEFEGITINIKTRKVTYIDSNRQANISKIQEILKY